MQSLSRKLHFLSISAACAVRWFVKQTTLLSLARRVKADPKLEQSIIARSTNIVIKDYKEIQKRIETSRSVQIRILFNRWISISNRVARSAHFASLSDHNYLKIVKHLDHRWILEILEALIDAISPIKNVDISGRLQVMAIFRINRRAINFQLSFFCLLEF